MARTKSKSLTSVEQQIMEVLWEKKQASAREITECLSLQKQTAFTTVQTMCKVLVTKGYVDYHKEGRAFVYSPLITQEDARTSAVDQLLSQFFSGSPQVLAEHLLQADQLDVNELEELQEKINLKKEETE